MTTTPLDTTPQGAQEPSGPTPTRDLKITATNQSSAYRRILRRETHSSRSGAAIVVLVVLLLVAAYVGVEAVCAALGLRPLLFSPLDVLSTLKTAAASTGALVIAAGIVAAIVGVILIIIGLTPGRRGRHTLDDSRVAVVVDDHVIAASLARRARLAGALAPGQVNAWVARSSARLTLSPATGTTADTEAVLDAVRDELQAGAYKPAIQPHVRVSDSGRLGA